MKSLMILGLGRKTAGIVGAITLCVGAFSAWNSLQAKLPEYMSALNEIQNIKEIGTQLENHGETVKERLRMKHFLVEEVLQKRIGWKDALGTYSWLCAQSQVPNRELNLAPGTREGIEKLVESFTDWAIVTSESETEERKCQLLGSFEGAESEVDQVEPVFQLDILTRFQEAEKRLNPRNH